MQEEEAACRTIGIPGDHIIGSISRRMLEYSPIPVIWWKKLLESYVKYGPTWFSPLIQDQITCVGIRPITAWPQTTPLDAIRAAEWHLYFPISCCMNTWSPGRCHTKPILCTDKDANYWVNIDSLSTKAESAVSHVSQWEPSIHHYRPDWDPETVSKLKQKLRDEVPRKGGHMVEAFRLEVAANEQ